jgi:hypothetical protein
MSELKTMLLAAPDTQLDACMFPLIEKWDEPQPTSIQILEVLDQCIFASLASDFVVFLLQGIYAGRLDAEGITHEDNLPKATWRT